MAMGIVTDKQFHSTLDDCKPKNNNEPIPNSNSADVNPDAIKGEIIDTHRGRGEGNLQVPNGLRKLIGAESVTNGRQSAVELAESLGISPSSVSAYDVGATSTSTYADRPNQSHIVDSKLKVAKRARNKLMSALKHITEDKLVATTAKDLSGIAKDMSAVIRNMEPEQPKLVNNDNGPKFVFYAPQFRKESNYEVVVAKE